jgi:hypothetical protein
LISVRLEELPHLPEILRREAAYTRVVPLVVRGNLSDRALAPTIR